MYLLHNIIMPPFTVRCTVYTCSSVACAVDFLYFYIDYTTCIMTYKTPDSPYNIMYFTYVVIAKDRVHKKVGAYYYF